MPDDAGFLEAGVPHEPDHVARRCDRGAAQGGVLVSGTLVAVVTVLVLVAVVVRPVQEASDDTALLPTQVDDVQAPAGGEHAVRLAQGRGLLGAGQMMEHER